MSIYDKASLVLIPSGTKTSKVYSQKPTNGDGDFTFSRSTAATRVNASGLIEKGRENVLTQSNTFSSADWTKANGATVTGGQSGYDGSSDAWLLNAPTAGSAKTVFQGVSVSGIHTASIRVKKGSTDFVAFRAYNIIELWADLSSTGVITQVNGEIDSKIISLGNGWFELNLTGDFSSVSSLAIYAVNASGSYDADAGDNIYIQDAQLEQGLVARDYIETTTTAIYGGITDNVPRLDYQGSCPALLLEPQRTNYLASSEYIANWQLIGSVTATANYGTSPEGVQNSTRLVFTGASQEARKAATSVTGCVASIYVKGTSGETIKFGSSGSEELFTLNGSWQRIDKYNSGSPTNITINTYSGATARDIEVWGAQVEEGSYATSYIPTYGSAVTRGLDSCYVNGISDIIGQSQGTLYFDIDYKDNGSDYVAIFLYDGTSANRLLVQRRANNDYLQSWATLSSSDLFNYTNQAVVSDGNHKIALAYAQDDFQTYLDGSSAGSDSSGSTYTNQLTNINLNPNNTLVRINQLMLFKTRLSNEELATLTTI